MRPSFFRERSIGMQLIYTVLICLVGLAYLKDDRPVFSNAESVATPDKNAVRVAGYGSVPPHFEANAGQVDERVKFLSRGNGYSLFLTSDKAVLALQKPHTAGEDAKPDFLRMKLEGSNPASEITGEKLLEGKTNYITGNDPAKWKTDIPSFERVRYSNVYEGVDVVYYGSGQQLEYDLVLTPNASPDKIKLKFDGAEGLAISENGDLVFKYDENELRQLKPVAYQEFDGQRKEVAANYVISNSKSEISDLKSEISNPESQISDSTVGFVIGEYDHSRPLIIDPVLSYSTYLGGGADTFGTSIAVDSSGSAYVTGNTNALDFPLAGSFQQTNNGGTAGFVTKLNPAGTAFVYSTYLGGNSRVFPSSIKVDAAGSAYVGGWTLSSNFPTTAGAYRNLPPGGGRPSFITKLSPSGSSLSYSTYFAGVLDLTGLALDSSGNAYVTGYTQDALFPTTAGAFKTTLGAGITDNAFVTKLNTAGSSLVYSTFVGARVPIAGANPNDESTAIAVDSSGNAYITGSTSSNNYPVTSGAFQPFPGRGRDVFVTKLNSSGSALVYSTYLGGSGGDVGTGIAVDGAGNAYVTGSFDSSDFPFTPNAFRNGVNERCCGTFGNSFLTKVNPTGTALIYSTALGYGNTTTGGSGVAVGSDGSAYVIGSEGGGMGIYSVNAVQSVSRSNDAFIVKMNPAGTGLAYSTPLGGTGIRNQGSVGSAIAIDATGNTYITGYTTASDFPVTSGAPQATKPGGELSSAFVAKIGVQPDDCPAIEINPQPLTTAIFGQSYNQQLTATGGTAPYTFSLAPNIGSNFLPSGLTMAPNGTISGTPTTRNFGTYLVTVQATAANGCIGIRTLQLVFVERLPQLQVSVLGRAAILRGRENRYTFVYTNNGDADALMVPLIIHIPRYFTWRRDFRLLPTIQPLQGPAIDYSQVPLDYQSGDKTVIPLLLPRIRARSSGSIAIIVTVPNQPEFLNLDFDIDAQLLSPQLISVSASSEQSVNFAALSEQYSMLSPNACGNGTQRNRIFSANAASPLSDCAQAIQQVGFDALGFIPGVRCETQVAFFLTGLYASYNDSGGDGVGTFTGGLAGAYSTAVGCALGASPLGNIVAAAQTGIDIALAINTCNQGGGGRRGRIVGSSDPNDKVGASGIGAASYLSGDISFPYIIYLENISTATAPAQEVVVTDQLDVSKFDLNTFSFGDVTVGALRLALSPNRNAFNRDFDLRPSNNIVARINAALDTSTGIITWRFQSIDPATGQPTNDPLAGFLPPNTVAPRGEGSVMFTVKLKSGLVTGAEVRNSARIVFDTNAPIDTPEWLNTIDNTRPTSRVQTLPSIVPSNFTLSWSGTDVGAGISSYTIYVSQDGGPFVPYLTNTSQMSAVVETTGTNHTFRFYSIATDKTGNIEPPKTTAEATATTDASIRFAISGRVFTPGGLGLRNSVVSLIDASGVRRTATTSSFGLYTFDNVVSGQTFTLTVASKRYRFSPRVMTVTGNLTNLDFVGLE